MGRSVNIKTKGRPVKYCSISLQVLNGDAQEQSDTGNKPELFVQQTRPLVVSWNPHRKTQCQEF